MTNIASIIFSDPAIAPAESIPANLTPAEQSFDALLAGLPGGVPVAPGAVAVAPVAFVPELLTTPERIPAPDLESAAPALPPAGAEADGPGNDGDPSPAPEEDLTLLSSCLAMWQILPPPSPQAAAVAPAVEDHLSTATVAMENFTPAVRSDGLVAAETLVTPEGTPVQVQGESSQPPTPATPRGHAVPNESPAGQGVAEAFAPDRTVPAPAAPAPLPATTAPVPATPGPVPTVAASAPDGGPESLAATAALATAATSPAPKANPARMKAGRPAEALEIRASRVSERRAEIVPAKADGIPVAKEQRAMQDPVFHPSLKSAPAAFAESEIPPAGARETGTEAVPSGSVASESPFQDEEQNEMFGDRREPAAPAFGATDRSGESNPAAKATGNDAKLAPSEVAQVIQHIERTVERMRSQGGDRIEMRLPLQDGAEVVVKLRLEHGEVKASFQSSTDGLQQALETGWSQVGQNSGERIAKTVSTVFESPSMQSGTGGFQQSPDQRDRRENGGGYSEAAFAQLPLPPGNRKQNDSRRAKAGAAAAASLQIYA